MKITKNKIDKLFSNEENILDYIKDNLQEINKDLNTFELSLESVDNENDEIYENKIKALKEVIIEIISKMGELKLELATLDFKLIEKKNEKINQYLEHKKTE